MRFEFLVIFLLEASLLTAYEADGEGNYQPKDVGPRNLTRSSPPHIDALNATSAILAFVRQLLEASNETTVSTSSYTKPAVRLTVYVYENDEEKTTMASEVTPSLYTELATGLGDDASEESMAEEPLLRIPRNLIGASADERGGRGGDGTGPLEAATETPPAEDAALRRQRGRGVGGRGVGGRGVGGRGGGGRGGGGVGGGGILGKPGGGLFGNRKRRRPVGGRVWVGGGGRRGARGRKSATRSLCGRALLATGLLLHIIIGH